VGVSKGKVAIFRGSNQNLMGISLSTLVSTSTLPSDLLGANAQASLDQTITQSGYNNAVTLVGQLQGQANTCAAQWKLVRAWVIANARYQRGLAAALQVKGKNSKNAIKAAQGENPGKKPGSPDPANCGDSSAFGISLTPPASPAPPVRATTSRPTASASARAGAKSTATAQPTATARATTG
jgi:hypothetical protein